MTRSVRLFLIASTLIVLWSCTAGETGLSSDPARAREALLDPTDPVWTEPAPNQFLVEVETSKGSFAIELHRDWAPTGVDRFYNLVRTGFYDDSRFYRVVEGFIVQFGVPGDPEISSVWRERTMPDDPVVASNTRGTIAYAMTGPDTRTTQLYINYTDNSRLDEQGFAPVGRIVDGMEVVDRLYAGYGETSGGGMRAGRQDRLFAKGNEFLDAEFPELDRLIRARIMESTP